MITFDDVVKVYPGGSTAVDHLTVELPTGKLTALVGPSGESYYPAFYADASLDRRSVEKVAKALGPLPAASKYFFFTSTSVFLGGITPLDALKNGRLADVSAAAAGFAEG